MWSSPVLWRHVCESLWIRNVGYSQIITNVGDHQIRATTVCHSLLCLSNRTVRSRLKSLRVAFCESKAWHVTGREIFRCLVGWLAHRGSPPAGCLEVALMWTRSSETWQGWPALSNLQLLHDLHVQSVKLLNDNMVFSCFFHVLHAWKPLNKDATWCNQICWWVFTLTTFRSFSPIQAGLQDGYDPVQLTVYQSLGYQDGQEKDAEQL